MSDELITYVIGQLRGACWEEEAAAVEALVKERDEALAKLDKVAASLDHIEELVKERDDLGRKLNTARYGQPDFAWSIHEEAMADLRAKLTKAVEALREISSEASVPVHTWRNGINFKKMYTSWRALAVKRIDRARTALAELEGM